LIHAVALYGIGSATTQVKIMSPYDHSEQATITSSSSDYSPPHLLHEVYNKVVTAVEEHPAKVAATALGAMAVGAVAVYASKGTALSGLFRSAIAGEATPALTQSSERLLGRDMPMTWGLGDTVKFDGLNPIIERKLGKNLPGFQAPKFLALGGKLSENDLAYLTALKPASVKSFGTDAVNGRGIPDIASNGDTRKYWPEPLGAKGVSAGWQDTDQPGRLIFPEVRDLVEAVLRRQGRPTGSLLSNEAAKLEKTAAESAASGLPVVERKVPNINFDNLFKT
jgi:hypothetical protein